MLMIRLLGFGLAKFRLSIIFFKILRLSSSDCFLDAEFLELVSDEEEEDLLYFLGSNRGLFLFSI